MAITPSIPTVMKQMRDLERRIRDLEGTSRLGSSSISPPGVLTVRDTYDQAQVLIGTQPDGTVGVTGRVSGAPVLSAATSASIVQAGAVNGSYFIPLDGLAAIATPGFGRLVAVVFAKVTIQAITGTASATLTVTGAAAAAGGAVQVLSNVQAVSISGAAGTAGQGTFLAALTVPLSSASVAVGINVTVTLGSATSVDFAVAPGSCAIVIPQ